MEWHLIEVEKERWTECLVSRVELVDTAWLVDKVAWMDMVVADMAEWVAGSCVVEVVETVETSNWTVGLVVVVTTSYQSCKVPTSFLTNWAAAEVVTCSGSAELRRS